MLIAGGFSYRIEELIEILYQSRHREVVGGLSTRVAAFASMDEAYRRFLVVKRLYDVALDVLDGSFQRFMGNN